MITHRLPGDENPPRWAERLLRALLTPANRDTVTGDLLEEYREAIRPARGAVRARLWYLRQVLSLALASNSPVQSLIWLAAAGAIVTSFVMRNHLDPPFPTAAWTAVSIGGSAALFMRPSDFGFLWRASVAFGSLFGAAVLTVSVVATLFVPLAEPDALRLVVYDGLRGQLVVACCAAIFVAAGFRGAWRGHRVGTGILAAMGTGVVGAAIWMGLATGIARLSPALLHRIGPMSAFQIGPMSAFAWPGDPFNALNAFTHSIRYVLMLVIRSIVPGAIGAMAGKGLGGMLDQRGARARKPLAVRLKPDTTYELSYVRAELLRALRVLR